MARLALATVLSQSRHDDPPVPLGLEGVRGTAVPGALERADLGPIAGHCMPLLIAAPRSLGTRTS